MVLQELIAGLWLEDFVHSVEQQEVEKACAAQLLILVTGSQTGRQVYAYPPMLPAACAGLRHRIPYGMLACCCLAVKTVAERSSRRIVLIFCNSLSRVSV